MMKLLLTPVIFCLLALWVLQVWQVVKAWNKDAGCARLSVASSAVLLVLTLCCLPVVSSGLYRAVATDDYGELSCPQDAVVVLGGGYRAAPDTAKDGLNGESALRVMKGVQVFQQCGGTWFVLSGRTRTGEKDRHGELMRELALRLGVPADRVLMETDSTNSREHPPGLRATGKVHDDARIAIVTSPWHLRRTLNEFRRMYPSTVGVPAYDMSLEGVGALARWLPQVDALHDSTRMISEALGMVWYEVLSRFSGTPFLARASAATPKR